MNKPAWIVLILTAITLVSQTATQTCSLETCGPAWQTSGDLTVGILANIHRSSDDGRPCSSIHHRGVEMTEAIKWIFFHLNNQNFIPGVKIGVEVYDACARNDVAAFGLVSMYPNFRLPLCTKNNQGIMAILSSSQSQYIAESLAGTNIPIISPTSTAPSLGNKTNYPTFFRTLPSDKTEIKVLLDIVKELNMKYIALVYSDDSYGREGSEEFISLAEGVVCIGGKFIIKQQSLPRDIVDYLVRLQTNLAVKNLPIVYIGQYAEANALIRTASSDLLSSNSQSFLWIFCDGVGITSSLFDGYTNVGRNAISVSPVYFHVEEFTEYWVETLMTSLSNSTAFPPYYQQYVETLLSCSSNCQAKSDADFRRAYAQTAFLNVAMDAAYVYAKAFKVLHNDLCHGQTGLCRAMRERLNNTTDLIKVIENTNFNFAENIFPFLPLSYENSTRLISFSPNSNDPAISPNSTLYYIHNTRCDTQRCTFVKVGEATTDGVVLDKAKITFYLTPKKDTITRADRLPSIACQSNCDACESTKKQAVPFAGIWGEILIVSFFTATKAGNDAFGCSDDIIIYESVILLETMLYAMDVFKKGQAPVFSYSNSSHLAEQLGIIVFNDCGNPLHASELLANWVTKKIELKDEQGRLYDPDKCLAVFGGSYSSVNLRLLPISKALNLVQVSSTATSIELEFDGTFLRTIPADDIQAQVMIDFIKKSGSNAVSVVYRDDSYGIKGYEQLQQRAFQAEICINAAFKIPVHIAENDVHDLLDRLRTSRPTKIVILFVTWSEAYTILKVANSRSNKKEFVWIGTESWGVRENMLSTETEIEALGSFTIMAPTEQSPDFQAYLKTLYPNNNSRNPFFIKWWETMFKCRVPTETTPNPPNMCSSQLSLSNIQEDLNADLARRAIWTVAAGLSESINQICGGSTFCSQLKTKSALDVIVNNIKNTEMDTFGDRRKVYTQRGDGNLDEVIQNVQLINGRKVYKEVARFHRKNGFNITFEPIFYDERQMPVKVPYSTCYECNCIFKNKNDPLIQLSKFIKTEGAASYIIAMLPVHASTLSEQLSLSGIIAVESLLSAIQTINRETSANLGVLIFDSYADKDLTQWHMVSLATSGKYVGLDQYAINTSKIIAFLTNGNGEDSLAANVIAEDMKVVHFDIGKYQISKTDDGYFFPLGFNIKSELQGLVAFTSHHKWELLQLLCSESKDSMTACDMMKQLLQENRICVLHTHIVTSRTYSAIADSVMTALRINGAHIIVALIDETDVSPFMDALGARIGRDTAHYPVFLGWSRFTQGLQKVKGTYKDICNNSIGLVESVPSLSNKASTVVNEIQSLHEDFKRNPWLTETAASTLRSMNLAIYYNIIDDVINSVETIARALSNLLQAECRDDILCDHLLGLTDWRERMRRYTNNEYVKLPNNKKVFDVLLYITKDEASALYLTEKIGEYDGDRLTLKDYTYGQMTAKCEAPLCQMCQFGVKSAHFPAWGIAFLIIVPLLLILLAVVLFLLHKHMKMEQKHQKREIQDTYLTAGSVHSNVTEPRVPPFRPPPLPSRETRQGNLSSSASSDMSNSHSVSHSSGSTEVSRISTPKNTPRSVPRGTNHTPAGNTAGIAASWNHRRAASPNTNKILQQSYQNPGFSAEEEPYTMSLSPSLDDAYALSRVSQFGIEFENPIVYSQLALTGDESPSIHYVQSDTLPHLPYTNAPNTEPVGFLPPRATSSEVPVSPPGANNLPHKPQRQSKPSVNASGPLPAIDRPVTYI